MYRLLTYRTSRLERPKRFMLFAVAVWYLCAFLLHDLIHHGDITPAAGTRTCCIDTADPHGEHEGDGHHCLLCEPYFPQLPKISEQISTLEVIRILSITSIFHPEERSIISQPRDPPQTV